MWRAFFLALGVTSFVLGFECLFVERAFLTSGNAPAPPAAQTQSQPTSLFGPSPAATTASQPKVREFVPPESAPWSLMSAGAVVILYSFTIPRRVSGG